MFVEGLIQGSITSNIGTGEGLVFVIQGNITTKVGTGESLVFVERLIQGNITSNIGTGEGLVFVEDLIQGNITFKLSTFNKVAIPNNKFLMASGQGSHWLIESPTIFSSMCSPPLSNICQF